MLEKRTGTTFLARKMAFNKVRGVEGSMAADKRRLFKHSFKSQSQAVLFMQTLK